MKKTILIITVMLGSFVFTTAKAQIHLGLNIGVQPLWGPVGYDHAEYYYMPDIDVFYSIPNRQYIYQERGSWRFSASLPGRYRNFDLNNTYKVVVNDARPYNHAQMYRSKYAGYRGNHEQQIIRNSHEQKYFENKDHPEHDKWKQENNREGKDNNRRQNDRQHHD
jgi:hypothetical protein